MKIYSVSHNSFYKIGFPWGMKMIGDVLKSVCIECGEIIQKPVGDREVILEKNKGTKWPDILGDGSENLFVVADRVLEDWKKDGVADYSGNKVKIIPPYPTKLRSIASPNYFWIDGYEIVGAKIDLEASGFVDAKICCVCGRLTYDIKKTYEKAESAMCPFVFVEGTWNGSNLFTTDLSPNKFFCTEKLVLCASKHKHLNFKFIPIELGSPAGYKGIDGTVGDARKIISYSRDRGGRP